MDSVKVADIGGLECQNVIINKLIIRCAEIMKPPHHKMILISRLKDY